MLKRLNDPNEEMVDIMLGNNLVLEALQFCVERLPITRSLARKFLEASIKTDELLSSTTSNQKILFFTVYTFFEEYFQSTSAAGASTQNSSDQKDELDVFKRYFNVHFRNQELNVPAVQ